MGKRYEASCWVRWCKNTVTVWDFHTGHNMPESKGGKLTIENLRPICAQCNTSMGDRYTISEWQLLGLPPGCMCVPWWCISKNWQRNRIDKIRNGKTEISVNKSDSKKGESGKKKKNGNENENEKIKKKNSKKKRKSKS